MSNDTKKIDSTKPAVQPVIVKDEPSGIPVKFIRFTRTGMQIPGYSSTDVVSAVTQPNGAYWQLTYIPAMRHHKIFYTDPNRRDSTKTAYVHETHVSTWEPALL